MTRCVLFSIFGCGICIATSAHGQNSWTWRNPLPTGNGYNSVLYADGRFVAVGDAGTVITSTNGVAWRASPSATPRVLLAVAYGDGQYVAVGGHPWDEGWCLTSTDATTWSTQILSAGVRFGGNDVVFHDPDGDGSNGMFVAVGYSEIAGVGLIFTSTVGSAWATSAVPVSLESLPLNAVADGGGILVVAGFRDIETGPPGEEQDAPETVILASTNAAVTWPSVVTRSRARLSGMAYGNGVFVGLGTWWDGDDYTQTLLTSTAPHSNVWTAYPASGMGAHSADFAHDRFFATGGTQLHTSGDGASWTNAYDSTTWQDFHGVAHGAGRFVAVGDGGAIATAATEGTWSHTDTGFTGDLKDAIYANINGSPGFVAIGQMHNDYGHRPVILISTNGGTNWTDIAAGYPDAGGHLEDVDCAGVGFVAVGGEEADDVERPFIMKSVDGLTWTDCSDSLGTGLVGRLNGVAFDATGSNLVAVGERGLVVTSSDSGTTWTQRNSGVTWPLRGVSSGQETFVAVGGEGDAPGAILASTDDGITWVDRLPGSTVPLASVAYGAGQFVALGHDRSYAGHVRTSTNGLTWVSHFQNDATGVPEPASKINYSDGLFMACSWGNGLEMFTSVNGVYWMPHPVPCGGGLQSVARGGGSYVIVGDSCSILTAPDEPMVIASPTLWGASDGLYTDRVAITWSGPANADTYDILCGEGFNPNAMPLTNVPASQTQFSDQTSEPGRTRYYWIVARTQEGLVSGPSNVDAGHRAQHPLGVPAWGKNDYDQAIVPEGRGITDLVAIDAGMRHTLGIRSDGTVVSWGWDSGGLVSIPGSLTGKTAIAVSAGIAHSLALTSDGMVTAWGTNTEGQIEVPSDLQDIVAIAAGGTHSVALRQDGRPVVWGDNSSGQCYVPRDARQLVAIAAGRYHCLGLRADGRVVGWGARDKSANAGQAHIPPGLVGVKAIAAGEQHSLALKTNGTVVAWGNNHFGQTSVPADLADVVAIAAGYNHNLAVRADGRVVAWGSRSDLPEGMADGTGPPIAAIAAGNDYGVGLRAIGPPRRIAGAARTVTSGRFLGVLLPAPFAGNLPLAHSWELLGAGTLKSPMPWLWRAGLQLADSGTYRVVASNSLGTASFDFNLTVADIPAAYNQWLVDHSLTGGVGMAYWDNTDGDSLQQIQEFALGENPTNSAAAGGFGVKLVSEGEQLFLEYTFRVVPAAKRAIDYHVEQAAHLLHGWRPIYTLTDSDIGSGLPTTFTYRYLIPASARAGFLSVNVEPKSPR